MSDRDFVLTATMYRRENKAIMINFNGVSDDLDNFLTLAWSILLNPGTYLGPHCCCSYERFQLSRSSRWSSGNPRMLIVLVRELGPRRGEILNLLEKDQLLREPNVGKHNSTRVDEGRKSWNLLAIKMQGTNRGGEGGEEPAMWPRIWVTTRRERENKD